MTPEDLPAGPRPRPADAGETLSTAVDEVGDKWSLLIVWAAAHGTTRFDDFHRDLSVARNILSNRLRRLVDLGILEKRPVRYGARRMEYALTDKGGDLRPALDSLLGWGAAWGGRRIVNPGGSARASAGGQGR